MPDPSGPPGLSLTARPGPAEAAAESLRTTRDVVASGLRRATQRLKGWAYDAFFHGVHRSRLVYNACWEDPRIDRALLGLGPDSRVVMITSAGCNALDYLLDDPAEIHAVDVNPRQNALLELKLRLLQHAEPADLWQAFGEGRHRRFDDVLRALAPHLTAESAAFWTEKRHYLNGRHFKRSFYFHGSSGDVAWVFHAFLLRRGAALRSALEELFAAPDLAAQTRAFDRLEPRLWNGFSEWLVRQPMTLSLLGVPRPQTRLITEEYAGGVTAYVRDKLRHVATQVPMHDNYFWRVYVTGRYSPECRPNYLRPEHFAALRDRAGRVRTHATLLADFLRKNPAPYSHYVLLDHQDWLAAHDPAALAEEWRLILENSRPGTRILFRSAAPRAEFLPEIVAGRVRFITERVAPLHRQDRVGTYGSLYLGEVL